MNETLSELRAKFFDLTFAMNTIANELDYNESHETTFCNLFDLRKNILDKIEKTDPAMASKIAAQYEV